MVRLVKEATTWTVKLDFTFNKHIHAGFNLHFRFRNKKISNICADHISISQGTSTNKFISLQPNETKSTNFDPSLSKLDMIFEN
jgi:hypothetical protein